MKKDHSGINPASNQVAAGMWNAWGLREVDGFSRCAECGHIGYCDSSPSQHASKHAAATGHPKLPAFSRHSSLVVHPETGHRRTMGTQWKR